MMKQLNKIKNVKSKVVKTFKKVRIVMQLFQLISLQIRKKVENLSISVDIEPAGAQNIPLEEESKPKQLQSKKKESEEPEKTTPQSNKSSKKESIEKNEEGDDSSEEISLDDVAWGGDDLGTLDVSDGEEEDEQHEGQSKDTIENEGKNDGNSHIEQTINITEQSKSLNKPKLDNVFSKKSIITKDKTPQRLKPKTPSKPKVLKKREFSGIRKLKPRKDK